MKVLHLEGSINWAKQNANAPYQWSIKTISIEIGNEHKLGVTNLDEYIRDLNFKDLV